jgi:RNA polymerase sigma-70 factor, ECF subfamily
MWRALLAVAGGRADLAKEAVAEAFARLIANAESVEQPRALLYPTGYRIVSDELRRERRSTDDDVESAVADVYPSELSPRLRQALGLITPEQRLAVFLTHHADLPLREVAELSGCSTATVRVRLHRARRALRALLEERVSMSDWTELLSEMSTCEPPGDLTARVLGDTQRAGGQTRARSRGVRARRLSRAKSLETAVDEHLRSSELRRSGYPADPDSWNCPSRRLLRDHRRARTHPPDRAGGRSAGCLRARPPHESGCRLAEGIS